MKCLRIGMLLLTHLAVFAVVLAPASPPAEAAVYSCFPTCSETDGRFLSLIGTGLSSLSGASISVALLSSPSAATTLEIGVFDGDTTGTWDLGNVQMTYTLIADPLGDGSGTTVIGQWVGNGTNPLSGPGWTASSASMPDNAWWSLTVTNATAAQGADGKYHYTLRATMTELSPGYNWTNFKLRALSPGAIVIGAQTVVFSFAAPIFTLAEAQVLYPLWPDLSQTTYDGTWTFYFSVTTPQTSVIVWDGDFDYGSYDCNPATQDTDDQDTPNAPFLPPWAVGTAALPEGVAVGYPGSSCVTTGAPWDDHPDPIYRRSPSVQYDLIAPDGAVYTNTNPSGTQEWEQFRVSTAPFNASLMDYHAASLPAGTYTVKVRGLDLENLGAFRFIVPAKGEECDTATGKCGPPPPVFPPTKVSCGCRDDDDSSSDYHSSDDHSSDDHSSECDDDSSSGYSSGAYSSHTYSSGSGTWSHEEEECEGGYTSTSKSGPGTWMPYKWAYYSSQWPVTQITIGGVTYTKAQAIAILKTTTSNLTYTLAKELIAAKLNVLAGNDDRCVDAAINEADAWLVLHPLGSSVALIDPSVDILRKYNMGYLCAPPRSWS